MLRRYFCPDYVLNTFEEATADFLLKNGIKALILDIDNTLAPYEEAEPSERVLAWFESLREAGIRTVFVSNNHRERVAKFNEKIGIVFYAKGKKPGRTYTSRALTDMNAEADEAAIMGDQIFTDVWAGRKLGVRTILVPPIRDRRDPFTKGKRLLEKPILRYYRKHHTEKTV